MPEPGMTSDSKWRARKSVRKKVAGSSSVNLGERLATGVDLVAMGTGQALHALGRKDLVELAAGAAVGVGHEDRVVARPGGPDLALDGAGDERRAIVQLGRQAGHVEMFEAGPPGDLDQLPGERAAADDEDPLALRVGRVGDQATRARRASIRRRAVSAATPASRQ